MKVLGGGVVTHPGQWGASCLFFSVDGINILIDCGIRLNTHESILPNLEWLKNKQVDILFITHSHADHIGAAPIFAAQHLETEIYTTFETAIIGRILLADNLEISARFKRTPIFTREEYEKFFGRVKVANFEEWQTLEKNGRKIRYCFWKAGHIRGSASILIEDSSGNHFVVTGDISLQPMPTAEAAKPLPTWFVHNRLSLVTEATNGNSILPSRSEEEQRLIKRIQEVNARGGHVLIPVFSVGRAQDVARTVTEAGIPIWLGGMAKEVLYSEAFGRNFIHPLMKNLNGNVEMIGGSRKPKVIVTAHGMLEGGQSRELVFQWMQDPKNAIFFTGYQACGTFGRKIQHSHPDEEIFFPDKNAKKNLQATVETFRLSAHTDGKELARWVAEINPQRVFVVHAETSGATGLRRWLHNNRFYKPVIEAHNENICNL